MKLTSKKVKHVLELLNWNGHTELGDNDLQWIAEEISNAFSEEKLTKGRCTLCQDFETILVTTRIGPFCENCIEELGDIATEMREEQENG